jgi:histidinol-phosphate aminotransferase
MADPAALRLYPGESVERLREGIAALHGTVPGQVFIGNGSSEVISLIMKVFVGTGGRVSVPDPTFGLYQTAAWAQGAEVCRISLNSRYGVDVEGLLTSGSKAVILVNPNAPTGLLMENGQVEQLVSGFPGLVVIDEAYMDFAPAGSSAMELVEKYANLIVLRTFSKSYSLSGARVGYCVAAPELTAALDKGKDIYNVNDLSARLALAALQDRDYLLETAGRIIRTREAYIRRFEAAGFSVLPSAANFLLCRVPEEGNAQEATRLYEGLAEQRVYVRYFDQPRLRDKLRITVGTEGEMERLWQVLESML